MKIEKMHEQFLKQLFRRFHTEEALQSLLDRHHDHLETKTNKVKLSKSNNTLSFSKFQFKKGETYLRPLRLHRSFLLGSDPVLRSTSHLL